MIPGDDDQSIQLFHTSLRDFLTSQPRSNNFFINPPTRHFSITTDCLSIITVQPEKGIFYDGARKYACLNWCYHLRENLTSGDHIFEPPSEGSLMRQLQDFASKSLGFWVNILLLDGHKKTLDVLDSILSVLGVSDVFFGSGISNYLTKFFLAITTWLTGFSTGLERYQEECRGAI
jgi:hypothetical protein